ncbi:MAG: glycosyltransferase [Rikenellaceae bacterium]
MLPFVLYLFFFAFVSQRKRILGYKTAKKKHHILIIIPAYKEDRVICLTVRSILQQDYPKEFFEVVVVSDQMKPETNVQLSKEPIRLLEVDYTNSTKAKAMNFALDKLGDEKYDIVVILDADNTTDTNFLSKINDCYAAGIKAIQAHRVAKNRNTDTAILDALSEEINNSIFRKGHVNVGISSALIGSGMAFDYAWFKCNIKKVSSMGEDKELEVLLMRQKIYIEYLDDVKVYDEKTQDSKNFYNQRRRWIATQVENLINSLKLLPWAISTKNIDLVDKIFSFMLLPRSILLCLVAFMSVVLIPFNWLYAIKWWILMVILLYTLSCATPNYLIDKDFYRAMRKLPKLTMLMIFNIFRIKGANKKFIHTDHENSH